MDTQSQPVRYWTFAGAMPVGDVTEGRISTGIAYHVEGEERLVFMRVAAQDTGALAWVMWLDRDSARELTASLRVLEPWFGSAATEAFDEEEAKS